MIKVHPLNTKCWYYTDLGRVKATILAEYVQIGGKKHKEKLALIQIKLNNNKFEQKTVSKNDIELI